MKTESESATPAPAQPTASSSASATPPVTTTTPTPAYATTQWTNARVFFEFNIIRRLTANPEIPIDPALQQQSQHAT